MNLAPRNPDLTFSGSAILLTLAIIMFAAAIFFAIVSAAAPGFGLRIIAGLVAIVFAGVGGGIVAIRCAGGEDLRR